MFGRILIWIVLAFLAWWLLRPRRRAPPPPHAAAPAPVAPLPRAEAMVDCACCGVHLPASEVVLDTAARTYCCAAHRDAGPRRDD